MSLQIIVTQDLMKHVGACHEARDYFTEQNLWGKTETEVLDILKQAQRKTDIQWWERCKQSSKFLTYYDYCFGDFRVRNLITNDFDICQNYDEAVEQHRKNLSAYLDSQAHLFSVCLEVLDKNGNAIWRPVDLRQMKSDDRYYVFNPMTGVHQCAETLSEAQKISGIIQGDYISRVLPVFTVEQKIISKVFDITAWQTVSVLASENPLILHLT